MNHTLTDFDPETRTAQCWGCNRRVHAHKTGNGWRCGEANAARVRQSEYHKALDGPAEKPEITIPDETLLWENWSGSAASWLKMLEKVGAIESPIEDEYRGNRGLPGEVVPSSSLFEDGEDDDHDMRFAYVTP